MRPPENAVLWFWEAGPRDGDAGVVEARVEHLVACGVEALLLNAQVLEGPVLGRIEAAAQAGRLPIVRDLPAEACWVRAAPHRDVIHRLAEQLVAGSGQHAFVCTGSDLHVDSLVGAARRLRSRVERLAWERFQ